jgi:hypothetical protein
VEVVVRIATLQETRLHERHEHLRAGQPPQKLLRRSVRLSRCGSEAERKGTERRGGGKDV